MDSLNRDRNQKIKAILSAVDGGTLSFSEINKRLQKAIDAELEKPDREIDIQRIETYEDLLRTLNDQPVQHAPACSDAKRRFSQALASRTFQRRIFSTGKYIIASTCLATLLLVLVFVGESLLHRRWLSGNQSKDEQQYWVVGHESDIEVSSQAIANESADDIEIHASSLEEIAQIAGNLLPVPTWIPESWYIQECYYVRNAFFSQLFMYYYTEETQMLVYSVTQYHDEESASVWIEQNFKGEYEQIGGKKIYISENIDQTVYLWSEDLMLYTIYSVADADENYKIILSVKE